MIGLQSTRIDIAATLIVFALCLAGCAGQISNSGASTPTARSIIYPFTAEEADYVLSQAMTANFPGSPISPVSLPSKGYTVTVHLLLDSHQITATAIPVSRRDATGKQMSGYTFEVVHAGTMIVSGPPRATALFESINQRAAAIRAPSNVESN